MRERVQLETALASRKAPTGIGGSDAAAVCGLNPYRSPVQVWLEYTARVEPKDTSETAYWGQVLEPVLKQELELRTEYVVSDGPDGSAIPPAEIKSGFMIGHPDGYVGTSDDPGSGILEVKTAGLQQSELWAQGVPPSTLLQVQHYLAITGLDWGLVVALVGGQSFLYHRLERDDELVASMIELEREFWGHVESDTPPAPDGSPATEEMLRLLYPEARKGGIVQLTEKDAADAEEWRALDRALKAAKTQRDEVAQRLKMRLGENETGLYNGGPLVRWPTVERKGYEVKPSVYRRFQVM